MGCAVAVEAHARREANFLCLPGLAAVESREGLKALIEWCQDDPTGRPAGESGVREWERIYEPWDEITGRCPWQEAARRVGRCALAAALRDVVGHPCLPAPVVDPAVLAWRSGTVPALARAIYDRRSFDELPVLADALTDAGCRDLILIGHVRYYAMDPRTRHTAVHARGCWAVDLLLGRM